MADEGKILVATGARCGGMRIARFRMSRGRVRNEGRFWYRKDRSDELQQSIRLRGDIRLEARVLVKKQI